MALIAGLGAAAEVAVRDRDARWTRCGEIRQRALAALQPLGAEFNGDPAQVLDHVLNLRFPGIDSEALMVALKPWVAISNGSACTSSSYTPSHVLRAMGQTEDQANEAVRLSWCHLTPEVDWDDIAKNLSKILIRGGV